MTQYHGECHCGSVKFVCEGEPLFTQYCHCSKCREIAHLSKRETDKFGYGFTAAYLRTNFFMTAGAEGLEEIIRNNSKLLLCKSCHSLIYGISLDETKQAGIGINSNNFDFKGLMPISFKPVRHIWYLNRMVDFNDDLMKYKDTPKEQFGSGELYSEAEEHVSRVGSKL